MFNDFLLLTKPASLVGNQGTLRAGDLQWMTAGRGIVHSEMPGWEGARGLQLWVNLPSHQKMVEPAYQELQAGHIPTVTSQGVTVRVIAGNLFSIEIISWDWKHYQGDPWE